MGQAIRSAVVIFASPNTFGHSPKARLVVKTTEVRSYSRLIPGRFIGTGSVVSGLQQPPRTRWGGGGIRTLGPPEEGQDKRCECQIFRKRIGAKA
jgi:hypothetical protein